MTTWRKLLKNAGLDWSKVEKSTLLEWELDIEFDDGYGGSEGKPFTIWTHDRVYFPAVYDGAEWVGSVPRHPCDEATGHVGGQ